MSRKIGIAEVARAAGVSTATVDRVLNGRGGVRPDKEERIIETARALGLDRALDLRPARTLKIAVLIQAPKNPFHATLREGFDLAARLYAGLNIQLLFLHIDQIDHAGSAARISGLIGQRDGLIISSPEDPRIIDAVRRFAQTGPVVTLATDLGDSGRSLFIGPDDERGGRAAADLMGLFLPGGGRVLMVAGLLSNTGQRARQVGFRNLLAERHPRLTLVRTLETGEDGEAAGRLVEQALHADPGITGIYHASAGALPICEALDRLGRGRNLPVITHELTPNRRRLLKERRLAAVIDQKPVLEARLAVEAMARLLGRLPGVAESVICESQIFMPEML